MRALHEEIAAGDHRIDAEDQLRELGGPDGRTANHVPHDHVGHQQQEYRRDQPCGDMGDPHIQPRDRLGEIHHPGHPFFNDTGRSMPSSPRATLEMWKAAPAGVSGRRKPCLKRSRDRSSAS
jgi:hypothetical protein